MFQRFHEMRERSERGFTLIELLVVILIIAILAAIAIPLFLNQRQKGWTAQQQSSLKNAATAMETCATENNGSYETGSGTTAADCVPASYGYSPTVDVTLAVVAASGSGFCLSATHKLQTQVWYYASSEGTPSKTACTTA